MKSVQLSKTKSTIRFNTQLVSKNQGSIFYIKIPQTTESKLPSQSTINADGTINGLPFQAALEKNSSSYILKVSKKMCDIMRVTSGDAVAVEITRLADESEIRVPTDLQKQLKASAKSLATWKDITPIARRDWIFWLISTKNEETRQRRIEKMISMLSTGKRRVCCFAGIQWMMKEYVNE